MKKLFVLASAFALVGTTLAQKPSVEESKYSLEGNLNYNAAGGIQWTSPNIRARYFVNDNIAGRVQLGLGNGVDPRSEKYRFAENGDGTGEVGTFEITRMSWRAEIGAEYHLTGTDRMSPYFAAGLMFGGGSGKATWTNANAAGTGYQADFSRTREAGFSSFGFGLGAGTDFYIFENVYLGLELGFSMMNMNENDVVVTTSTGGVTTTTKQLGASMSEMGTSSWNTAFRLGWRF